MVYKGGVGEGGEVGGLAYEMGGDVISVCLLCGTGDVGEYRLLSASTRSQWAGE